MKKAKFVAMNIVNQLFDLAEVPVDIRQRINDKADIFVTHILKENFLNRIHRLETLFREITQTKPISCDGNPDGDYACDIHQRIALEALTGKTQELSTNQET